MDDDLREYTTHALLVIESLLAENSPKKARYNLQKLLGDLERDWENEYKNLTGSVAEVIYP